MSITAASAISFHFKFDRDRTNIALNLKNDRDILFTCLAYSRCVRWILRFSSITMKLKLVGKRALKHVYSRCQLGYVHTIKVSLLHFARQVVS